MNLQGLVESRTGQIVTVLGVIALLALITIAGRNRENDKKADIKAMTVSALLIAMAMLLSNVKIFTMPQGGSVTLLSLLPVTIVTYL